MKKITVNYNMMVEATWAKLNKQNTLPDYIYECSPQGYGNDVDKMKVTHIVTLTAQEWAEFTHSFLKDTEWLAGLGGTDSSYIINREVSAIWELTEEERKQWMANSYRLGLLVVNEDTGETLAIDPQGYDYARYVGLIGEYQVAAKVVPTVEEVTEPVEIDENSLSNGKCSIVFREDEKEIFGRDLTDHYNEPAFMTRSKRGIKKAWQALQQVFTHETTMREAMRIISANNVRTHYWCMMD